MNIFKMGKHHFIKIFKSIVEFEPIKVYFFFISNKAIVVVCCSREKRRSIKNKVAPTLII